MSLCAACRYLLPGEVQFVKSLISPQSLLLCDITTMGPGIAFTAHSFILRAAENAPAAPKQEQVSHNLKARDARTSFI